MEMLEKSLYGFLQKKYYTELEPQLIQIGSRLSFSLYTIDYGCLDSVKGIYSVVYSVCLGFCFPTIDCFKLRTDLANINGFDLIDICINRNGKWVVKYKTFCREEEIKA